MYTSYIYNEQTTAYFIAKISLFKLLYNPLSHDRRLQSTRFYQDKTVQSKHGSGHTKIMRYCNGIMLDCNQDFQFTAMDILIFS
jgi:hypothetical protein